jgi:MFS family permease
MEGAPRVSGKFKTTGLLVLTAASLVSAVLGSIHAFSVFLIPLETQFSATRGAVSLSYSMALVALTLVVLLGPQIYARRSAATLMLLACGLGALGAVLAGLAPALWGVWLGYSLIFGAANGLGYGFGMQISAQLNPGREGLAMGVVTAAYALGSVVSPALFEAALHAGGIARAMNSLALCLICVGLLSALLMHRAKARFHVSSSQHSNHTSPDIRRLGLLWLAYFGGVTAGLMVIGHAAGIAAALHPGTASWLAPVVIAALNLAGALVAGRLADTLPPGRLLSALAGLTAIALAGLASLAASGAMLAAFGLIGFAYGGTIAVYPAAIAKRYGMQRGPGIYGRVFTAWGAAGLIGPWLAGVLFDAGGGYHTALWSACLIALASAVLVRFTLRPETLPS